MSQPRFSTASQGDALVKYEQGSICWLKARDDSADDVEGAAELPVGCYNHPAVLLWTEGSGTKATIFIVSASSSLLESTAIKRVIDNVVQWSSASRATPEEQICSTKASTNLSEPTTSRLSRTFARN